MGGTADMAAIFNEVRAPPVDVRLCNHLPSVPLSSPPGPSLGPEAVPGHPRSAACFRSNVWVCVPSSATCSALSCPLHVQSPRRSRRSNRPRPQSSGENASVLTWTDLKSRSEEPQHVSSCSLYLHSDIGFICFTTDIV